MIKKLVTIMADYGNAPYAWLRELDNMPEGYLGGNIADAVAGFPVEFGVSSKLEMDFASWAVRFERDSESIDFPWKDWNEQGRELTRRLEQEIGENYLCRYVLPEEDPSHVTNL